MPQHSAAARSAAGARNNAQWCAAVGRSLGIPSTTDAGMWVAHAPMPPGYPEAVSLEPRLAAEDVISRLPHGASSVKDSFADLDLSPFGFEMLFDARWIARGPLEPLGATEDPEADGSGIRFDRVDTPAALGEWARAHGNREAFASPLLDDPAVLIVGARREGELVAGAALNDSEDAVGLSNVFGPVGACYRAAVVLAAERHPGRPIVGWEPRDQLAAARGAGFAVVGTLRVWAR